MKLDERFNEVGCNNEKLDFGWPNHLVIAFAMLSLIGCKTNDFVPDEGRLIEPGDEPNIISKEVRYYDTVESRFLTRLTIVSDMYENSCLINILWDDAAGSWMVDSNLARTLEICSTYSTLMKLSNWPYDDGKFAPLRNEEVFSLSKEVQMQKLILQDKRLMIRELLEDEAGKLPTFETIGNELTEEQFKHLELMDQYGHVVKARKIRILFELTRLINLVEFDEDC